MASYFATTSDRVRAARGPDKAAHDDPVILSEAKDLVEDLEDSWLRSE
jgi:hypothetical protein